MYEAFFSLRKRPFLAAPLEDRYFPAHAIESSRQTLARCIDRAEGAAMVVGPSGTGKSLLLRKLAEEFRDRFAVVLLDNSHLTTRRALLQAILFELGLPYRGMEEGELRLSLLDQLAPNASAPDGLLLLLDEAHALPTRLMEEVRMITNVVRDGESRARLVMAGGPALEERLASPKLASLAQRVVARCYLQSMNENECTAYCHAQMDAVGGGAESLFTDEAIKAVHRATDGVPRLVNQLCDHALVTAFEAKCRAIDGGMIEQAWAELQQLPAPWNETSARESQAATVGTQDDVVSFGALTDDLPPSTAKPASTPKAPSFFEFDDVDDDIEAEPVIEKVIEPVKPTIRTVTEAKPSFHYELNPFSEQFADEEVIFDRYASVDVAATGRGRVYSAEGGALSAMLEPFMQKASPKSAPSASREAARDQERIVPTRRSEAEATTIRMESVESWGPIEPPAVVSSSPNDEGDHDMIIIEDVPHGTAASGAKPVHFNEYRQLFASLRRG